MLLASPHAGFSPALREVICFHSPIGSGPDFRRMRQRLPNDGRGLAVGGKRDRGAPSAGARTVRDVGERLMLPLATSTVAMPLSPSTSSPKRILSPLVHPRQPAGGSFHAGRDVLRLTAFGGNHEYVAAYRRLVTHDAGDEGDPFPVRRPRGTRRSANRPAACRWTSSRRRAASSV